MKEMKKLQYDENDTTTLNPIEFPRLSTLKANEVKIILRKIGVNKAINGDMVSDLIFRASHIGRSSRIFEDLWTNANKIGEKIFISRVVALNKEHPNIGTVDRIRPIVVNS
jgi:hypothetical protein